MAEPVLYARACAHYQTLITNENDLIRSVEQARGTLRVFLERVGKATAEREAYEEVLRESAMGYKRTLTASTGECTGVEPSVHKTCQDH